MTKGRAKITTNSEGVAPAQTRSLRSGKREFLDDQSNVSDIIQPTLPQQNTEGNVSTAPATPAQAPQSPLQECATTSTHQEQAAQQSIPAIQNVTMKEEYLVAASPCAEQAVGTAAEGTGQEETVLTNPNNEAQLKDLRVESASDNHQSGEEEEEMKTEESNRSSSHTLSDQSQPSLPRGNTEDGSCTAVCEEQRCGGGKNVEQKMKRNQDGQQESNSVCVGDDTGKGITKEAAVGLPAKKKRRMGMCHLTERERNHFLQILKRENGHNGTEGDERQSGNNKSVPAAEEEIIPSIPSSSSSAYIAKVSITERNEAEMKLQSRHCGGEDRAETEVHVAMTTSDGTSNVCDPGCSKGESCQTGSSVLPDPGQINGSETDPPAEREGRLGKHPLTGEERQELEGSAVEIMVENCEKQRQDGEGGSGELDSYPATGFSTITPQSEGSEREQQEGNQAAPLRVDSAAGTRDGRVGRMGGEAQDGDGAEAGASSAHTSPGGIRCGSEELCKAAVTPSASQGKSNCVPDDNLGTGPSPVSTEHPQTRDAPDPFGSGYLDYVSDSQLNNIVLIEEEVEADGGLGASDCHEDATDLVCGLIRELSSLNRTVMATHRELESLRRGNKASRVSMR